MSAGVGDLAALLRDMSPALHDGVYVYAALPLDADPSRYPAIAMIRELEGITVILPEAAALKAGLRIVFRAAWITLTVHSDLQAVGLTAAFSRALADAGIPCNVVAGVHHDHLFVPVDRAEAAMRQLRLLQPEQ